MIATDFKNKTKQDLNIRCYVIPSTQRSRNDETTHVEIKLDLGWEKRRAQNRVA